MTLPNNERRYCSRLTSSSYPRPSGALNQNHRDDDYLSSRAVFFILCLEITLNSGIKLRARKRRHFATNILQNWTPAPETSTEGFPLKFLACLPVFQMRIFPSPRGDESGAIAGCFGTSEHREERKIKPLVLLSVKRPHQEICLATLLCRHRHCCSFINFLIKGPAKSLRL